MENKITILCVGDRGKAMQIAKALSDRGASAGSVVIVDSDENEDPLSLRPLMKLHPLPEAPYLDKNIFAKKQSEGRRCNGSLKRR